MCSNNTTIANILIKKRNKRKKTTYGQKVPLRARPFSCEYVTSYKDRGKKESGTTRGTRLIISVGNPTPAFLLASPD